MDSRNLVVMDAQGRIVNPTAGIVQGKQQALSTIEGGNALAQMQSSGWQAGYPSLTDDSIYRDQNFQFQIAKAAAGAGNYTVWLLGGSYSLREYLLGNTKAVLATLTGIAAGNLIPVNLYDSAVYASLQSVFESGTRINASIQLVNNTASTAPIFQAIGIQSSAARGFVTNQLNVAPPQDAMNLSTQPLAQNITLASDSAVLLVTAANTATTAYVGASGSFKTAGRC